MAKAKPSTETALNDILLTFEKPLTLKQIAYKAGRKTGKPVAESEVLVHIYEMAEAAGMVAVVTRIKGVDHYEVHVARPANQVLTPAGVVPAASLPTHRPIRFGRPASNVPATPEPAPKQVAGSRAAQAFIDSLQGTP